MNKQSIKKLNTKLILESMESEGIEMTEAELSDMEDDENVPTIDFNVESVESFKQEHLKKTQQANKLAREIMVLESIIKNLEPVMDKSEKMKSILEAMNFSISLNRLQGTVSVYMNSSKESEFILERIEQSFNGIEHSADVSDKGDVSILVWL